MQLIPRYLVSNRSLLTANEAGFITEYRPVYNRQQQVYRGIDNVLQFKLLNSDQKPIDLSAYTPKFQAFDENDSLIIEHDGTQVLSQDGSTPIKGLFELTITENDLVNVKDQFLHYSVHLKDANNDSVITYSNSHFENDGVIKVSSGAYPGPRDTYSVTQFTEVTEDTSYWVSESMDAEPGINGNEALHTAAIYSDNYIGDVTVQATLDNQVINGTSWADLTTVTLDGTETTPTAINFYGVYAYLRFKTSADPAEKITKVLVRN